MNQAIHSTMTATRLMIGNAFYGNRHPKPEVVQDVTPKQRTFKEIEKLTFPWRQVVTTKPVIVLYNPVSIDSVNAVNLLLNLPHDSEDPEIKYQPMAYDRFNDLKLDKLDPGIIYAIGVEVSVHDLGEIIERRIPFVGTCYRDSYSHYTAKELERVTKRHPKFWLLFPENTEEFAGTHLVYSTNTAMGVVRRWMLQSDKAAALNDSINAFGEYWHFADTEEDSTVLSNRRHAVVRNNKVLLTVCAEREWLGFNPVRIVFNSNDTSRVKESYFERQRIVRLSLKTTLTKPMYGNRGEMVYIPTAAVPEAMFREACEIVMQTNSVFVGYEDTATHRIWRIFARKQADRHWIAQWLKPLECWSEGSVYCAITAKPQMHVN